MLPNRFTHIIFLLFFLVFAGQTGFAQRVNISAKTTFELPNGEEIVLFPAVENPHGFYCLPSGLRLSVNQEKQPEFLLMLWASESGTSVDNGIMHWLLTWGLTAEHEKMVSDYLIAKVDSNAVLLGAVIGNAPEKYIFNGKNKEMLQLLQRSVTSGGGIPTVSGGKSATSFKFKGPDAQTIEKYAKDPEKWKGVSIEMPFYGLNNEHLCTLRIDAAAILVAASGCEACFLLPEK